MGILSVSDVARMIEKNYGVKVRPRMITGLFYDGVLRGDLCPIRSGRRLIPVTYVPQIEAALRRRGKLPMRATR